MEIKKNANTAPPRTSKIRNAFARFKETEAKAKQSFTNAYNDAKVSWNKVKDAWNSFCKPFKFIYKHIIKPLAKFLFSGFIMAIILNCAVYFWPELPETIPVTYTIYNCFLQIVEWVFTTAIGGIASIFNGNVVEFNDASWAELCEICKSIWALACNQHF